MLKDFPRTAIWQTLLAELDKWEDDIHGTQSDPDEELSERLHASLRGSLKAIDRFRQMPLIMAENLLMDESNKLMSEESGNDERRD